ncbi:transmembrane protein 17B-like isoform X2 [Antedon mediterranea]|uniref:transmembrane protein 17B-like isoform X2 n=1 Tax=Antedon mediterranea TaxID=105859 RepID=UPI003AF74128
MMAADYMRQKLTTFTEAVFPARGIRDPRQHHLLKPGNELVTSLPLQMLLYFNVFYFPFWIISCIVMLELKFLHLQEIYQFIHITVYIIMSGTEIMRLYLGYLGNLQERVPELAGFWLLTLVLQLPLCALLLAGGAMPFPIERAIHIVLLLFLFSEVLIGYHALKVMSNHQVMKFHLQQFDDVVEMQNGYHHLEEDPMM